jgi:hypothetical protein
MYDMWKIAIAIAPICVLASLFVVWHLRQHSRRIEEQAADKEYVLGENLTLRGAKTGYFWGLLYLIPSLSVVLWVLNVSGDSLAVLFVVVLALPFWVLSLYGFLVPLRQKIEFKGDVLYYRDPFGFKYKIAKGDIKNVRLTGASFIIKAGRKEYYIMGGFADDARVWKQLIAWAPKKLEEK